MAKERGLALHHARLAGVQPQHRVHKAGLAAARLAQQRKGEMEELGVPAEIKRGSVNGKTVYRVYTNPMDNPQDVNRVRTLLTGVGIDILQKRVSD